MQTNQSQGSEYSVYLFCEGGPGNHSVNVDGFSLDHAIERALEQAKRFSGRVRYAHKHKPLCKINRALSPDERVALANELRHQLYYGRDDDEAKAWTEQQIIKMSAE